MKSKILYASFIVLIIVIIIGRLIAREIAKIQPAAQELKPPEETAQEESALSDYTQEVPSAPESRLAITVIKKPEFEQKTIPASEEAGDRPKEEGRWPAKKQSALPKQSPDASAEETDESATETPSSITTVNKQPTPQEQEKMDARGIIIY